MRWRGSLIGLVGGGLRAARRLRGAARQPRHYRDSRTETVIDDVHEGGSPAAHDHRPAVPAVQHPVPARRRAGAQRIGARVIRPARLRADRQAGRRGDQRVHDGCSTPHRRMVPAAIQALGLLSRPAAGRRAGEVLAPVTREVRAEIGVEHELPVTTVGSHDTSAVVFGAPAETSRFGYISCGTGSSASSRGSPVLSQDSRRRTSPTNAASSPDPERPGRPRPPARVGATHVRRVGPARAGARTGRRGSRAGTGSRDAVASASGLGAGDAAVALSRLELIGYLRVDLDGRYARTALATPAGDRGRSLGLDA